jgi:hypothetical protein
VGSVIYSRQRCHFSVDCWCIFILFCRTFENTAVADTSIATHANFPYDIFFDFYINFV